MGVVSSRATNWAFWLLAAGFTLLLPSVIQPSNTRDAEAPLPLPGRTTNLLALRGEFRAPFDDRFALSYDVVVDPRPANEIGLPERPPVPCRFLLTARGSTNSTPVAVVNELKYGAEFYTGNVATFSSELFDLPKGTTAVSLTNLGCREGYQLEGGTAHVGAVGEHLMIPIYMMISRGLGLFLAGVGISIELLAYARTALHSRRRMGGKT